jgi:hypothetical protein
MSIAQLRVLCGIVRRNTLEVRGDRAPRALLALCALASASCMMIVDSNKKQCREHSDCAALFGSDTDLVCIENVCVLPSCEADTDCSRFGSKYEGTVCVDNTCKFPEVTEPPEWACLDTEPAPISVTGPFQVQAHFQHMARQTAMADVTVRICRKLDVDCVSPESMGMTDANGDVSLSVPANFTGYISANRGDLMATRYYFSPAINADLTIPSIQLVEPQLAKAIVMNASSAPQMDDRGLVLLSAFDCMLVGAVGISFESADADDDTKTFYAVMSLPSATATETATGGFGGFLNVPAGNFRIDAQRVSDGRKIGEVTVLVRPGELTITRLVAAYQPSAP